MKHQAKKLNGGKRKSHCSLVLVWSSNMAACSAPPPDTKEGDPDLVILSPSWAAEGSPGGLVSKWESLQHYTKQALLTNAWGCSLFPWWAQDFLPPRNPRRPGSTGREISAQHAPSFRNLCVPLGSRLLCFLWEILGGRVSSTKESLPTSSQPGSALYSLQAKEISLKCCPEASFPHRGTRAQPGRLFLSPDTTSRKRREPQKNGINQVNQNYSIKAPKIISSLVAQMIKVGQTFTLNLNRVNVC